MEIYNKYGKVKKIVWFFKIKNRPLKFILGLFTKMAPKMKKEAPTPPKAETKARALKANKAVLKGFHSRKKKKIWKWTNIQRAKK